MDTQCIRSAVEDAYLVMQFASGKGIFLAVDIVNKIVVAKENVNSLQKDQEVDFWMAYAELSKIVLPTTLDSILAKKDACFNIYIFGKTISFPLFSGAKRSVFYYTLLTVFSLVAFLFIQMYSFTGMSALNEIRETEAKYATLPKVSGSVTDTNNENNLKNKKAALYVFLSKWNNFADPYIAFLGRGTVIPNDKVSDKQSESAHQIGSKNVVNLDERIQQYTAEFTIKAINLYIVPMIAGTLGVCSYVLRKISIDIQNDTFAKESRIRLRLRIPLGCLAGAVTGIFFFNDNNNITTILPPIAIAFAFGYSIEVFFSILDNVLLVLQKKINAN